MAWLYYSGIFQISQVIWSAFSLLSWKQLYFQKESPVKDDVSSGISF